MQRDLTYRAWCSECRINISWVEPTGRRVRQLLCPDCGSLVNAIKGTSLVLKGDRQSEARTYYEDPKRR